MQAKLAEYTERIRPAEMVRSPVDSKAVVEDSTVLTEDQANARCAERDIDSSVFWTLTALGIIG